MELQLFGVVATFLLGIVMGSFLDVVASRMGTGVGVGGRSKCDSCSTTLAWYELFPVASFLLLGRKCRTCRTPLSWRHPVIEIATGIAYAFAFVAFTYHASVARLVVELVMLSSIVVIAAYDSRHMIIPQVPLVVFAVTALLAPGITDYGWVLSVDHIVGGLALFAPFYLLWRISDGKWIGLGDADLAACMGLYLGVVAGFSSIALAFAIGAIYASVILLAASFGRRYSREVPFAPFLLIGFVATYMIVSVPSLTDVVHDAFVTYFYL